MDRCVLLVLLLAASVCAEDRWVWSEGLHANNVRTPRIPGRVEPHLQHLQPRFTTPAPDITTFRPRHPVSFGPSITSRSQASTNFPPFLPFMNFAAFMGLHGLRVTQPHLQQQQQLQQQQKLLTTPPNALLSRPPSHALPLPGDGTTKSRVTEDTAVFDSMAILDDEDKYTTLDKHQSQYKRTRPLPRPREEHLGGLDPREVFYADEDLLIIKGGGFNSDKFEEPSQSLDDSDQEFGQGSEVSPLVLPNPDLEYNGNVPAILPPPPPRSPEPIDDSPAQSHFAVFVESPSRTNSMILQIPYVYPYGPSYTSSVHGFISPFTEEEHSQNSLDVKRSAEEHLELQSPSGVRRSGAAEERPRPQLGHSLSGDTAVNYAEPRPSINSDAEFVVQDQPHVVLLNEATSGHHKPQVIYQQPHFVYHYTPGYRPYQYQHVYNRRPYQQPKRVEIYKRPQNHRTRPRPKL